MALCSFADRFSMFDVTPVENLFIEEYMLHASGDFVKVYLYGLHLCYHPIADASPDTMATALGLEKKTVEDAFAYWERRGIVRKIADAPAAYTFINLKALFVSGRGSEDEVSEGDLAFNHSLQGLFGSRILQAPEYERLHALMEDYGFARETVLRLVMHCIESSGKKEKTTISYIEKQGKEWAKRGVFTLVAAEDYLRTLSDGYEGAGQVLKYMGLVRSPSVPEEQLYEKWRREWGFSHEAILYGCKETTKIGKPNFAYLDRVLESRLKQQQMTSAAMEEGEKNRTEALRPVREVLEALGQKALVPTQEDAALYSGWRQRGFTADAILAAARYSHLSGQHTLKELGQRLQEYAQHTLFSARQIQDYNHRENEVMELLRLSGARQDATPGDIALYVTWLGKNYSKTLIAEAAERAKGKPFSYINTILDNWAKEGITTVEAARRAHEQYIATRNEKSTQGQSAASHRPFKEVSAQRFDQRQYTEEELEALLYVDIDKLNKPEE